MILGSVAKATLPITIYRNKTHVLFLYIDTYNICLVIYKLNYKDSKLEFILPFDELKNPIMSFISLKNEINLSELNNIISKLNNTCEKRYIDMISDLIISIYNLYFDTSNEDVIKDKEVKIPENILQEINKKRENNKKIFIGIATFFTLALATVLLFTGIGAVASVGLYGAAANSAF